MASEKVYLSKSREAAVKASGKTLAELIDLGLEALSYEQAAGSQPARHRRQCPPHPPARIHKGLCGACGTNVG